MQIFNYAGVGAPTWFLEAQQYSLAIFVYALNALR